MNFYHLGSIVNVLSLITLSLFAIEVVVAADKSVNSNKRFDELKSAVFALPYQARPTYKVSKKTFGKPGKSEQNQLRKAALRTLRSSQDLIDFPGGQKLLQANGICFSGDWIIDKPSQFTGLFQQGSASPIIARASVALSGVKQKNKRAFGLAIKLLPNDLGQQASLNIFTANSLGGVVNKHVLDLKLDNNPPLGRIPNLTDISTALRLRKDLESADRHVIKETNSRGKADVTYRSITHIAAYQPAESEAVIAPKWIRFRPANPERVDKDDFRDELDTSLYQDQKIVYQIDVAADHGSRKSSAKWQTIGKLELTDSVTSKACDAKLHFQHPGQ